ncbi:MAG TPA: flavin reductase family protein, partial [Ilumatobacteraceae bacterium]
MIDPTIKRSLGQMMKGVQVVGAHHDGVTRAYCSHWVCQVSFEEPIVMASVSPKHDTHPLIAASGQFAVSVLAGDQVDVGQYFSYPGRKFRYIADEYLEPIEGSQLPVVRNCIAWMRCETFEVKPMIDHEL